VELARRIRPDVSYSREGFEAALFGYYRRLWSRHALEMLDIYWNKLRIAGSSVISKILASPLGPVIWPLAWVPNGVTFLLLHLALLGLCLVVHLRIESPLAFTVALVTAAGFLLQLESALVYPIFDMTHHSSQLLCFLVLAVLAWQLALESARIVVQTARKRRLAGRSQT
jgi:hypothetical protein